MMAHKSKKTSLLFRRPVWFVPVFHSFFFLLGKVIFLVVITRWCSIWKSASTSHSPSFIIYIYMYVDIYTCVCAPVTSNCSFILLALTGATERIFVFDRWWSTLVIHTQMICMRDESERERERRREKSPKDVMIRFIGLSFLTHLFFLIDHQVCIEFRGIKQRKDRNVSDNWSNKYIYIHIYI